MEGTDFRSFIISMLKIAKINAKHREAFTDPKGMELFLAAFTHPTFDEENNYQELEFVGDGIIKGVLSQYLIRRFAGVLKDSKQKKKLFKTPGKKQQKSTGEGILSKIRRHLEQRKTLSDFGLKLGFWPYVRADQETKTKLRKETLEDVFEAFIGVLVEIVDRRVKRGLGYNYAYNFLEASLDDMEINLSAETLDDPITRLNELYKANELKDDKLPLKWGDAAYYTQKMYFPKLDYRPRDAKRGQVFFSIKDKVGLVFDGKDWIHVSRAPLMNFDVYPANLPEPAEDEEPNMQLLWYAGVFGFPRLLGKGPDGILDRISPKKILENPEAYGADIIGQGMAFKVKDSKKMAASQALHYLKRKGYQK